MATRPTPPAPHVPGALGRSAQAKPAPAIQPRHAARPAAPQVRAAVVQRMEDNRNHFTSKSTVKPESEGSNSWTFMGQGGETLKIVDDGRQFKAYLDGKYVGYLSYEVETEEGVRRMRFGYISITAVQHRSKRISSVLIFLLAVKALENGLKVICVGHPDPGLRTYWEAMGFDFAGAQHAQWLHNVKTYGKEAAGTVDSVTAVTEATAFAPQVLGWARGSLEKYWKG
ncbi:MAG TPA: hypothetical protein VKK31_30285 [Thermoanaerobaculia bacterium]|nr:hypothetical protein [Thermoanaerobaculia bacterium]